MSPMRGRLAKLATPYYRVQASAVLAWWLLLLLYPSSRDYFLRGPASDRVLLSFAAADLLVLFGGSLLAARPRQPGRSSVAWAVAGGALYATLFCLMYAALGAGTWLSVLLMLPSTAASAAFAWLLSDLAVFREARSNPARANLTKTFLQIVVFWGFFLWLVPALIRRVEDELGLSRHQFAGQDLAALLGFLLFSGLGLWSGLTMAARGKGTPLPLDAPRKLVIGGPYAYLRNPMAVAGLGQGLAIGFGTGSLATVFYTVIGGLLWHYGVRPLEEEEMRTKFGTAFDAYRTAVPCWFPRWPRYRMTAAKVVSLPPRD